MNLSFVFVALGGAAGSVARYGMGRWIGTTGTMPWGTLAVNIIGSFLIGLCVNFLPREHFLRLLLVTGFLGGFTTFSAFSIEAVTLLKSSHALQGFFYITASVLLSLGAAYLGTQVKTHG